MTETGNEKSTGFWRTAWKRYRRSRIGMLAFFFLIALAAVAFFAPMLANDIPIICSIEYTRPGGETTNELYSPGLKETLRQIPVLGPALFSSVPPFSRMDFKFKKHFKSGRDWAIMPPVGFSPLETSQDRLQGYSGKHWLGTDELGRDVMARMIYGTQVSMRVGFISMGIAALIGLCLGAIAGFFGGWVDMLISRVIEIFMCFPVFFLILAVLAWFPPRIENIMIIIGLTRWVGIARLTRGEVLRLRELEYTAAAKALGAR
ncbi:MAG: ABC transporter permease, partial [Planctomycetes bacterium]|nr:ABC transporter permease [Planctomycetota bacterium]